MQAIDQANIAEITARMLLEVKAVLFSEGKPFIFTSGWASPVYIDCRKLILHAAQIDQVEQFLRDPAKCSASHGGVANVSSG